MTAAPAIRLRGVSFTYRGAAAPALREVSLDVRRGEFVVIMGATGAGKSTLAKCLNRSVPAFQPGSLSGSIELLGESVATATVSDLAGVVGLVSQDFEAQLFATNVQQEVAFGMEQLGVPPDAMRARLAEALQVVGLAGFEGRDPATLSGGEKQRVAIAAVLALQPAIVVFDEPTTDLDPLGKEEVFDVLAALRGRGFTIVLIEHETSAAERADRLLLMSEGRIVADDVPDRLLREVDRLDALGVRPLDLDRIGRALAWPARAASIDAAAALVGGPIAAPPAPARTADDGEPPLLAVDGVGYAYGDGPPALADVSLAVQQGEFVALIGQNGSGKTTLAKCLNGLLHPQRGTVRLRDTDVRRLPLHRVAADVGYVFQDPDHQLFAATVGDEVAFALRNFDVDADECARRAAAALEAVGLTGCDDLDPFLLGKGQRQRLAVASLLALQPAALILEEPTTGLDYPEQRRMMDLLARLHAGGMTLIVITHSPWVVAQYAHRGILMQAGRVVHDGPLRALFAEETLLARCRFRVPDVTRLGLRLGFAPLSVEEFVGAVTERRTPV